MTTPNTPARVERRSAASLPQPSLFFSADRQRELFNALADAVPDQPASNQAGGLTLLGAATTPGNDPTPDLPVSSRGALAKPARATHELASTL